MNWTCHHQSQYDRIVEEKDAELQENKKKETEDVAHRKSLVSDKLKYKWRCCHSIGIILKVIVIIF